MLKAFIETPQGTIKVHDDGAGDFIVTYPCGKHRFFSIWSLDYHGSLQRTIDAIVTPGSVVQIC